MGEFRLLPNGRLDQRGNAAIEGGPAGRIRAWPKGQGHESTVRVSERSFGSQLAYSFDGWLLICVMRFMSVSMYRGQPVRRVRHSQTKMAARRLWMSFYVYTLLSGF